MVCDIQGTVVRTKIKKRISVSASAFSYGALQHRWTDPQLLSVDRSFGRADIGREGMKCFFRTHRCGATCRSLGLKSVTPPIALLYLQNSETARPRPQKMKQSPTSAVSLAVDGWEFLRPNRPHRKKQRLVDGEIDGSEHNDYALYEKVEIFYGGEWHDGIVVRHVETGLRVKYSSDATGELIYRKDVASRIRRLSKKKSAVDLKSDVPSASTTNEATYRDQAATGRQFKLADNSAVHKSSETSSTSPPSTNISPTSKHQEEHCDDFQAMAASSCSSSSSDGDEDILLSDLVRARAYQSELSNEEPWRIFPDKDLGP
uniref:Alpha-type protein kinase domain-containing protein n=2 Tax=Octactis speculum TaxID=3111310 RepID=A0A7S2AQZ9_9STRA|mmetsp:Transcript_13622/g.18027  ORF Transcript_13622/g.18027 Transcript_13622/m.18027 type:complete len:317 (+) Transcript_13622:634-1584(+)